mgnify:FL=1
MTTVGHRGTSERGSAVPPPPPALHLGRLPRRRRWGLTASGVVLVVVCAVAAYLLVVTTGLTRPYLAVTHRIPYGAVLTSADLTTVNVNTVAGLRSIPANQRAQVVGRHAAVELFPGTLLTRAQLADRTIPAPGQQLVGIDLKPAQLPARPLKAGDPVVLVIVPPAGV